MIRQANKLWKNVKYKISCKQDKTDQISIFPVAHIIKNLNKLKGGEVVYSKVLSRPD